MRVFKIACMFAVTLPLGNCHNNSLQSQQAKQGESESIGAHEVSGLLAALEKSPSTGITFSKGPKKHKNILLILLEMLSGETTLPVQRDVCQAIDTLLGLEICINMDWQTIEAGQLSQVKVSYYSWCLQNWEYIYWSEKSRRFEVDQEKRKAGTPIDPYTRRPLSQMEVRQINKEKARLSTLLRLSQRESEERAGNKNGANDDP